MLSLLLVVAFFQADIKPTERPVYSRDLVSMYAGKRMAMAMQTIPGSPFGAGGGAPFDPTANITFSGNITFTGSTFWGGTASTFPNCSWNTTQTPDNWICALGTTSRGLVIIEAGDEAFDFAHAQQTNPTLFIHSAAQSTTQYLALFHDGTDARIQAGAGAVRIIQNVQVGGYLSSTGVGSTAASFYPEVAALTPDSGELATGTTANSLHLIEQADTGFDFNNGPCGTTACAQPTLIIHSATQNTTDYLGYSSYGLSGGKQKTLTAASATGVVQFPVVSGGAAGASIIYGVFATDGTDHQLRQGRVTVSVVNKAGTETCAVYGVDVAFTVNPTQLLDGSGAGAISAGTLTYTWGVDTTPANACTITLNAASSLAETLLLIVYIVQAPGGVAPIPQ